MITVHKNGLNSQWNSFKTISVIIFFYLMISFYLIYIPCHKSTITKIIHSLFYILLCIFIIYNWYKSCTIDPIDDLVGKHSNLSVNERMNFF